MPRGLELNNPLNLRLTKDKWKGKSEYQPDAAFVRFDSPEMGLRAAAKVLFSYEEQGYDTVGKIVTRWAPSSDSNPTDKYIAFVCGRTGFQRDQTIDVDDFATMKALICAMGRFEQGTELPYSDQQYRDALDSAGVHNVPKASIVATPEATGGSVAAIGTAATATLAVVQQGQDVLMQAPWIGQLAQFIVAHQPKIAGILVLMIAAGGLYALWSYINRKRKGL